MSIELPLPQATPSTSPAGRTRTTLVQALDAHPAAAIGMITTAALARVLGKSSARAGRDWCQRHRIPYRRDGKHNWVRLTDLQRVLDTLPVHGETAARDDAAAAAVAALMKTRR